MKFSLLERQAYLMGQIDMTMKDIVRIRRSLEKLDKQMDKKGYGK